MKENHTLTLVITVFNDMYCDLYLFTPEQKKLCANLTNVKTFNIFAKNLMSYPLMRKIEEPSLNLASLVRNHINNQFVRINDLNIKSYIDMPQGYDLYPMITVENNLLDEVWLCDFRIGKNFYVNNDMVFVTYRQRPKLYRADETVCDDDCSFDLAREELDDVISTVKRCGDEVESFNDLSLFAVRDDRSIEVCPFSIGNKDYFVQKARKHADDDNFLRHKTYVYEYNKGKTNKVYGCTKFEKHENVVALDLEKDKNHSMEQKIENIVEKNKITSCTKDNDQNVNELDLHFEFQVDDIEALRLYCKAVIFKIGLGKTTIKARFLYNKLVSNVLGDVNFCTNSAHHVWLNLYSPDGSYKERLGDPEEIYTLKSTTFMVNSIEESKQLECEIVFEKD